VNEEEAKAHWGAVAPRGKKTLNIISFFQKKKIRISRVKDGRTTFLVFEKSDTQFG
jgi:hypothetical protein